MSTGKAGIEREVEVRADDVRLEGMLVVPERARGLVVFAHGSGSSRHSPRNQFVARELNRGELGTLLFDLLTSHEDEVDRRTRALRFDIDLLAERVMGAVDWVLEQPWSEGPGVGLFGSSTGAAAALIAAAKRPARIRAVVSRGGRVDLAEAVLPRVEASTLCIVGERDPTVLQLNRDALEHLGVRKELRIIPDAGHLFEEPGALEQVAEAARDWFREHLAS